MAAKEKPRVGLTDQLVLIGIGLAAIYWVVETLIYIFEIYGTRFFERLAGPDFGGLSTRLIVLCLFVIFGAHAQYNINQQKQTNDELLEYCHRLEKMVAKQSAGSAAPPEQEVS